MTITAKQVKELRDMTGAGIMECKDALRESNGDKEKAIRILRERGAKVADKKAGRTAKEGTVYGYVHGGGKIGVLVEVNCETDFVARTDEFKEFAKNIALQVCSSAPLAVSREGLPEELIETEREIYRNQARNEGKPEHIIERIVEGKLEKFFKEKCLLEQPYIRDPDITVGEYLKQTVAKIKENIVIRRFVRFELGESS